MIVRGNGASLWVITQPDHAALAGRVMRYWSGDGFGQTPRQGAILTAIEEHDNGWREADLSPIVDASGHILDFVRAPDDIRRGVWPRGVERLAATPYAAALVAQHALHIFRRYRPDPEWAPFFTELTAARDRHLRACASTTLDDLLREYFFVRIGDLISLTFCNAWSDVQKDDAGAGYAMRLDGTRLIVTPDPFGGREVPLQIAARELPNRPFRSATEARDLFESAPAVTLAGIAAGR